MDPPTSNIYFTRRNYPLLETLHINLCSFPHSSSTIIATDRSERGLIAASVIAASVIAANLRRAHLNWKLFRALTTSKVISTDFQENYETRRVTHGFESDVTKLAYGAISHFIVHDLIRHTTTVMPFRSVAKLRDATGRRMREPAIHEWRDEDKVLFHV